MKVSSRAEEEVQAVAVNRAGSSEEVSATAIGNRDSRSTVHCGVGSETSGNEVRLSQSEGDGKFLAAEVKVSSRAEEELQATEVKVAGRADAASAAALGIEDSRITVHCGLGSEASGNEVRLSPSEGDGKLQAPEVAGRADKASAAALAAEVKVSSRADEEL